jgi:hypothetical protein
MYGGLFSPQRFQYFCPLDMDDVIGKSPVMFGRAELRREFRRAEPATPLAILANETVFNRRRTHREINSRSISNPRRISMTSEGCSDSHGNRRGCDSISPSDFETTCRRCGSSYGVEPRWHA